MDFLKTSGTIEPTDISEVGITDGLVGWWPLNGNANDITVNGNDGTVSGATVSSGLDQLCYSFDGVDDYINLGSSSVFNFGSNDFSISCWLKTSVTGKRRCLVDKSRLDSSTGGYSLEVSTGNVIAVEYFDGTTPSPSLVGTKLITDNVWHHVVLVWVAANILNRNIYIDGEVDSISRNVDNTGIDSSNPLQIAATTISSTYNFGGSIQDVRIYNRALSAEEVKIQYELTKNRVMNIDSTGKLYTAGKIIETY